MAMDDLHKGAYTGQFVFFTLTVATIPATTTRSSFSLSATGSRSFSGSMEDDDDDTHGGPLLEKPAVLNTDPGVSRSTP